MDVPKVVYHGTNRKTKKFRYERTGEGNNQEGFGFYMTSSIDDARRYGRYVLVINPVGIRRIVRLGGRPNQDHILKMILSAPDVEDSLQDWDIDRNVAIRNAVNAYGRMNPHDAFASVSGDFYRYRPAEYLKNMVKVGYDGVMIKKRDGVQHFVGFDPNKLKIVRVIDTKK